MSFGGSGQGSLARGIVASFSRQESPGRNSWTSQLQVPSELGIDSRTLVPEAEQLPVRDLTDIGCFVNTLRGNLGPGCLSLPHAFADTGLWLSMGLGMPIICVCIFCMNLLLWVKHDVATRGGPSVMCVSYSDVAQAALGLLGRIAVEASVLTGQLGVCIVYHSFVSTNLHSVFPSLHPRLIILAMIPVASALTLLRTPGKLSMLSFLGNALMMSGIIVVLASLASRLPSGLESLEQQPYAVWTNVPSFAANLIFSFEGVALTIPMQIAMVNEAKFPKIMTSAMATVAVIFFGFAIYCLVGLGGVATSASISASLQGRVPKQLFAVSNLTLAAAVLLTYPLQFYPAIEILECYMERRGFQRTSSLFTWLRIGLSVACGLLALAVPNVGLLISLVGSLGNPVIGLILPALIHMKICQPRFHLLMLDALCIAMGGFVAVFGTYSSVRSIATSS